MKTKLNYLPHVLVIAILLLSNNLYAETDDSPADSSSSGIALDAIHIDLTSLLFINDISVIADIELTSNSIVSFGLQPSYSLFGASDIYGYTSVRAKDISFLTYFSLGHNFPITLKAMLGFSYRMWTYHFIGDISSSDEFYTNGTVGGLKYGIAVIINISRFFKIHAKLNVIHNVGDSPRGIGVSAYGIGFSFGWSR